jgi:hypothetical protein
MVKSRKVQIAYLTFCALCLVSSAVAQDSTTKHLTARGFDSGFSLSNGTFNGMLAASNGKIYYVLCSGSIDKGAQMYSYDPATDKIKHLGDLTEASGEKDAKSVPQGKSHVNFVEYGGKLYFATHVDYYTVEAGLELMAPPPSRIQAISRRTFPCVRHGFGAIREFGEGTCRSRHHCDEYGYWKGSTLRSLMAFR